ncbi:MAG: NAD(P)-binding protein [Candidatus Hydrogenedens sp.]|nr:NAD(P)-binding protein [Candidatus Hydrogenedens sp.]
MQALPRACVIGAGPSGLAACKALKQKGIPFECFELADEVGGVWYYNSPTGRSACYKHLHINTSKSRMEFDGFPMPESWPNFCRHDYVHTYFKDFCAHYGLREHIVFNTGVERCERDAEGVWNVRLSTGETRQYDALFVCNGHHWDPRWPEPAFPGTFSGREMHAHDYRVPEEFAGKRVVVLGMGNSAMDIAVELSYLADRVFLAHRRGAHIVPKYLFGRPVDKWAIPGLPLWLNNLGLSVMLRLQVGKVEQYGLKRPDHGLLAAHPTISSTILDRVGHGDIEPRDNIAELVGNQVKFADGTIEEADVIIYCTGYKVTFPFFDPGFISAPDNDLPLFQRMLKPGIPNLFFIGLYQPLGAIFPIAERQGHIAADYLAGEYLPPSESDMLRRMERERKAMFKRYVSSKRHTMQVDYDDFMAELKREWDAGKRRARAAGGTGPMPSRATESAAV